jgi:hypothetical protein
MPDDRGGWAKVDLFCSCVASLTPSKQRMALLDLCNCPPAVQGPMPDEPTRERLKQLLFHVNSDLPVGGSMSHVTLRETREAWWKACSRLPSNPAAALTSAGSLLETVCREILDAWGQDPPPNTDVGQLVKQTLSAIGVPDPATLEGKAGRVLGGLNSIVGGIRELRNSSGEPHALIRSGVVADEHLAELAVNACGVLAVFLVERHMIAVTTHGTGKPQAP